MENLSTALRTWRVKHNWKQDVLADKLGISRPQYSKIEGGEKPLTIELLVEIATLFKINPTQLLNEILSYDGAPVSYFKAKASVTANDTPYDAATGEDELTFYKKLAAFNEQKYLDMYKMFLKKCNSEGN